ncbi:MAG: hypothetical protein RR091_12955, partial [Cloacibacillus sp.]
MLKFLGKKNWAVIAVSLLFAAGTLAWAADTITTPVTVNGTSITSADVTVDIKYPDTRSSFDKAVEVINSGDITFTGTVNNILLDTSSTGKACGAYIDGTITFAADNTNIDVKGIGGQGAWGYGVDVRKKSTVKFTGKSVSIKDYQRDYTAQTLTVRHDAAANFTNSGNVSITAESPFGSTVVDIQGSDNDNKATLTFDNAGDTTLNATNTEDSNYAKTNVIGTQINSGGHLIVTPRVQNFSVNLYGAGVDDRDDSYSSGAVAIKAGGDSSNI